MPSIHMQAVSSLEKIFPERTLRAPRFDRASCLLGEIFSYQIAFSGNDFFGTRRSKITVTSDLEIEVYDVDTVPVNMPSFMTEYDNGYLVRDAAVIPDLLSPSDGTAAVSGYYYKALWIRVKTNEDTKPGIHTIKISLESDEGDRAESVFTLKVLPVKLPGQKLLFTEWLHCDCISSYYGLEPLSEKHWEYIKKYVRMARENGINMLLTPVFTPPLDTKIGAERPTVQLVEVFYADGAYTFDFSKLGRWLALCRECGIEYIEVSHLYSQWGAHHAPKIIVHEDGRIIKKFGWQTDSLSEEYRDFLSQLLPALTEYFRRNWNPEKVYFHLSDEPNREQIERYGEISRFFKPLLGEFQLMDALSDYEIYEKGYVSAPVSSTRTIDEFIRHDAKNLWAYYCCGEGRENLSNRFISMPSCRNRVMGAQLYKFDIKGFLHWGYNFYYSQYSTKLVNPFVVNDADGGFPAGDSFSVYPGSDGPLPSLRLFVFFDALQDLSALRLLEELTDRKTAEDAIGYPITFKDYPQTADFVLSVRERVNDLIEKNI